MWYYIELVKSCSDLPIVRAVQCRFVRGVEPSTPSLVLCCKLLFTCRLHRARLHQIPFCTHYLAPTAILTAVTLDIMAIRSQTIPRRTPQMEVDVGMADGGCTDISSCCPDRAKSYVPHAIRALRGQT